MTCYHPQKMFPPCSGGRWVNSASKSYAGAVPSMFPCGGCQGCRAGKTAQWATRMGMESRYHEATPLFVTWTYADEFLPDDFSVSKREVQLLIKRIRYVFDVPIRTFTVGEYGEAEGSTLRPHYHSILWGLTLDDLCDERRSQGGFPIWKSPRLEGCWGKGFVDIASADRRAMSYCAGYVFKKLGGARALEAYRRVHPVTGEILQVSPEFALMSRRPGIGFRWAEEFRRHDLQKDFTVENGHMRAMPTYLINKRLAWLSDEGLFSDRFMAKLARSSEGKALARKQAADLTPERLAVREEAHRLRTMSLARGPK